MLEVQKGCNGVVDTCILDNFSYPNYLIWTDLNNLQTKRVLDNQGYTVGLGFSYGFYFRKLTCLRKLNPKRKTFRYTCTILYTRVLHYKKIKSKRKFKIRNIKFIPVSVESTGVFGPRTVSFVKDLGRRITRQSGNTNATTYLRQRLSMAIQRGNALSVLGTCNFSPPLFDLP